MPFTFSIVEQASVTDPTNIFPTRGASESDTMSDSAVGSRASFDCVSTNTITTALADGNDDFPDDNDARLNQSVTLNGVTYSAGARIEGYFEVIMRDEQKGYHYLVTWLAIDNQPSGVSISRAWDATTGSYVDGSAGIYKPGTSLTVMDGDTLDGTPNITQFATDSDYTSDGIGNDAVLNQSNGNIECFFRGIMPRCKGSDPPIPDIITGDAIWTRDHGLQTVRWIESTKLSSEDLENYPKLRPIRIRARDLGLNTPASDLIVSP